MNIQHHPFFTRLMPFIGMGVLIVIFVVAFVLLSYLLLIGAAIGLVLFCVAYIKNRFFRKARNYPEPRQQGRIYDHDDYRRK